MERNKIKLIQKINSEIEKYKKDLEENNNVKLAEKKINELEYTLNTLGVKSAL